MATDRLTIRIDQLTHAGAHAVVEPLLREYLEWASGRLFDDFGFRFDDAAAEIDKHHEMFRRELPALTGARGRLLVARRGDEAVGVGAMKPIDDLTAEIKRMYVAPSARGLGVGRTILERLLDDARSLGYHRARLETARFMVEAHGLYRSLGFIDTDMFDGAETAMSGIESFMIFMELPLGDGGSGDTGEVEIA